MELINQVQFVCLCALSCFLTLACHEKKCAVIVVVRDLWPKGFFAQISKTVAQSFGAVEYTDCISAEE